MRILLEVLAFAGISLGMALVANTAHADEAAWYVASAKTHCVNEWNARAESQDRVEQDKIDAAAQIVLDRCDADVNALTPAKIARLIAAKDAAYAAERAKLDAEINVSVENAQEEFATCFRAAEQAGTDPVNCL